MPNIVVYYHDPVEVDLATSWTGLCSPLTTASYVNISTATNSKVLALFDYARPDAVITVNDHPVVSIEQTAMNPSGHNIPQRFSSQVRAAELGIPSILYYPEFSRRTFSDPNVRYLNIRVPLAQLRLTNFYNIPAVSVFWPTDSHTKLPTTKQGEHQEIAALVNLLIESKDDPNNLVGHPTVKAILIKMDKVAAFHSEKYDENPTVRRYFPTGLPSAKISSGISIDLPNKAHLMRTVDFVSGFTAYNRTENWPLIQEKLFSREFTIVFSGTTNHARNDSEHPWPGYLTLIDILYARSESGKSPENHDINLVYSLPIPLEIALPRLNNRKPPTPTYIVDTFSDLLVFSNGVVPGRPIRKSSTASAFLLI